MSNMALIPVDGRATSIMSSATVGDYRQLCVLCGYLCPNKVTHRLCFCNKLTAKREKLWNLLITKYGYQYCIAYSKNAPL